MTNRFFVVFRISVLVMLVVLTLSCENERSLAGPKRVGVSDAVAGSARAALTPDGKFIRNDPAAFGRLPLISAASAAEFAVAFVRQFGSLLEPEWSREYGATLNSRVLGLCGQVQFLESAFEPFDEDVSLTTRKEYGPRYWVQFCDPAGRKQLMVAVSALATDLRNTRRGLEPVNDLMVTFNTSAIPNDWNVPFDAEGAAQAAFIATGAKVTEVPRVFARSDRGHSFFGRWRVILAQSVRLRGAKDGVRSTSDTLLLSDDGRNQLQILRDAGPDASTRLGLIKDDGYDAVGHSFAALRLAAGTARNVSQVEVQP